MTDRKNIDKEWLSEAITDIWDPLTDEQRDFLLDNVTIRTYKTNEPIYSQGETPRYLMCLMEGKVKVFMDGNASRQIVRTIKERGIFSFRAAFAHESFRTGASAFEPSVVCCIPLFVVRKLLINNSELALFFIRELAKTLGDSDKLMVSLTQKHVRGRLAEALLALKEKYGMEANGSTLSIYLSREDLANMSNMTTSNAIRTLSAFASEGLIAIDGRKIKFINEEELRHISNMG